MSSRFLTKWTVIVGLVFSTGFSTSVSADDLDGVDPVALNEIYHQVASSRLAGTIVRHCPSIRPARNWKKLATDDLLKITKKHSISDRHLRKFIGDLDGDVMNDIAANFAREAGFDLAKKQDLCRLGAYYLDQGHKIGVYLDYSSSGS